MRGEEKKEEEKQKKKKMMIIRTSIDPSAVDLRALFHHTINEKSEQLNRYTV
jgi:hypothetical protein